MGGGKCGKKNKLTELRKGMKNTYFSKEAIPWQMYLTV
jgi:hypothetical protein